VVILVGCVGKSWILVLAHTCVTPNKDLWKKLCVLDISVGNRRGNQTRREIKNDPRLGGRAELVEVGGLCQKVTVCRLNLGEFVTRANMYVTILGSYDIVIDMDWLELHEVILNCKMKQLSLVDDEGKRHMIIGWNQGFSPRFISALQLWKSMHK
jgi:hypothetical protein